MTRFARFVLSISSLALFGGCQGDGYKPDFAFGPTPYRHHTDDSVVVLATMPAIYEEVGAIKVDHDRLLSWSRRGQWEGALSDAKSEASKLGANALVVSKLERNQKGTMTEVYSGIEDLCRPSASSKGLKADKSLTVLAIRVP